ncbi:hypothetical protein CDA63_09030 [Hymenobacter amundsenii]|uniref:Uncharacterized protein n=2 Tax=Hymenobacter amundsenii TaxID=2006685 RepID=A0A246FLD4_9BACT|nr:hypothetical protein CDA63_09030 [Hymenobacter amundsenii]
MPAVCAPNSTTADELLAQPTTYNDGPASDLLTPAEVASGCRLYEVPNSHLAPALLKGDYVVCQPLSVAHWAAIAPKSCCLILRQYEAAADGSWPTFQGHSLGHIVSNGLRYGGELLALQDDGHSDALIPSGIPAEELVGVCKIVRSIRFL